MTADIIQDTEKRGTTYQQQLAELIVGLKRISSHDKTTSETYTRMLGQTLKSFEGVRVNTESQIRKLREEMARLEATLASCKMFSNVLIGIVTSYANELYGESTDNIYTKTVRDVLAEQKANEEKPKRMSDTEMLQKICRCGCVDEEDAATCKCKCHVEEYCDDPQCYYCMQRKTPRDKKPTASTQDKQVLPKRDIA